MTTTFWNSLPDTQPRHTGLNGKRGWYAIPGTWFVRVVEQQYQASPNEDFSGRVYYCKTNEVGQLVFQDLMADINGRVWPEPTAPPDPKAYFTLRTGSTAFKIFVADGVLSLTEIFDEVGSALNNLTMLDQVTGSPARIDIVEESFFVTQTPGQPVTVGYLAFIDSVTGRTTVLTVEDSDIVLT